MRYDKLVRDKIPEVIRARGGQPVTHIADSEEYIQKLREKLEEEVAEFIRNNDSEELADIIEIVYAMGKERGLSPEDLESMRKREAEERGDFKERIILEES
ncbi:MAG: nucleoside triphosphate pyrophosphohydrolase [Patescibacteria group bacterium]